MKNRKYLYLSIIATGLMFQSTVASASIEAALANICNIVKANDKSELRKKMKTVQSDYRIRLGDYYDGVTCGGNSLIRTAILNDAVDTGTLLVKRLPKSQLRTPEKDGLELAKWIEANGHAGSPIASVVQDRL